MERLLHNEVGSIDTPIGLLPKYEDLETLFQTLIDKEYDQALYAKQFSLYINNVLDRIELQTEAFKKDPNIPDRLFEIYNEQKAQLLTLKQKYGSVVTPDQLSEAAQS